jgi:hypothetical protein
MGVRSAMTVSGLVVVTTLFLAGCSGALPATVSGKVTLDGQLPPPGTFITFALADGSGRQANSVAAADGSYSISSGDEKGLVPGEYLVLVAATEKPDPTSLAPPTAPKRLTPDKYADKKTTPFKFKVTSGHNTIDLPMTK